MLLQLLHCRYLLDYSMVQHSLARAKTRMERDCMRAAVLMHNLLHDCALLGLSLAVHVRAAVHDRAVHAALRMGRAAHTVHNRDHD